MKEVVILRGIVLKCETEKLPTHINSQISKVCPWTIAYLEGLSTKLDLIKVLHSMCISKKKWKNQGVVNHGLERSGHNFMPSMSSS